MRYKIQELNLGGILDQAIALLKNRFVTLMAITCFFYFPLEIVYRFAILSLVPATAHVVTAEQARAYASTVPAITTVNFAYVALVYLIVSPLTNAAAIFAISNEYLERPAGAIDSYKYALRVFVPLLLTSLLSGILIIIGLAFCLVPGIILAFRYWCTSYVVVIEGVSGRAALKRSAALMGKLRKGNADKALILGILLSIIYAIMGGAMAIIPSQIISTLGVSLIHAVIYVFGLAASVVFYFSCRCKLEHFDLQLLAEAVGAEPVEPAAEGVQE